jgi:hypothetical protein
MSLSGNVPFNKSAEFFSKFSKYLIIEFPKRKDSWVQRLLNNKAEFKNHFQFYNLENFVTAYSKKFEMIEQLDIKHSDRTIILFKNLSLS